MVLGLLRRMQKKVTSLRNKFEYANIASFDEFIYFTSVEIITGFRNSALSKISFHQGVKGIGNRAFLQTTNLNIILNCPNLETIELKGFESSGITAIDNLGVVKELTVNAFSYCYSLIYAKLPNTISSIGDNAFRGDSALKAITVEALTPPTLGSNVFYATSSDLLIYVPDESVEAYKTATGWIDYADKIKPISEYVEPTK